MSTTTAVRQRADQLGGWARTVARFAWSDRRLWPMGAGALVLAAALLASAGGASARTAAATGRTGFGLVAPWLSGYPAALVALGCVAVPGALIAWGLGFLAGMALVQNQPRRERVFVARAWRRRITGFLWYLVGLVVWMVSGWSWSALLAWLGLVVVGILASGTLRARARTLRYLLRGLSNPRSDSHRTPEDNGWSVSQSEWAGRHLLTATVFYPSEVKAHLEGVRTGIEQAVGWNLSHRGVYGITWNSGERSFTIYELPKDPLPDRIEDRPWPDGLPGSVVGITTPLDCTARVDWTDEDGHNEYGDDGPLPVLTYTFDSERHLLVAGGTGGGKTVFMRGIVVRSVQSGEIEWWWIIDGKGSADYASLEGRKGIRVVAYEPADWDRVFREVIEVMQERYKAAREYEAGRGPKPPAYPRLGLLMDEFQEVRAALGASVFDQYILTISRLVRAATMSLLAGTQRPDVSETLPGSARDQFIDRAVCGWMSKSGARMMLDDQWRVVTGDENAPPPELPRGRAVIRIDGRVYRIQVPYLGSPVREPKYVPLYPPKVAAIAPPTPPEPPTPTRPERTVEAPDEPADNDSETPLPDNVRPFPKRTGDPASAILAALATAGPAGRRRAELDETAGTSAAETRAHLDALIKAGHVLRSGSGMGTRYRLTWHAASANERVNDADANAHQGDENDQRAASGETPRQPQRRRGGRTD